METSDICRFVQLIFTDLLVFCWLPVARKLCNGYRDLFSQEDFHVLKNVFTNLTWFHFNGYTNSQISRTWIAENPRALHENPLHSPESLFGVQCLEKELWDHFSVRTV
jgi:hypothetical protein